MCRLPMAPAAQLLHPTAGMRGRMPREVGGGRGQRDPPPPPRQVGTEGRVDARVALLGPPHSSLLAMGALAATRESPR